MYAAGYRADVICGQTRIKDVLVHRDLNASGAHYAAEPRKRFEITVPMENGMP